MTTISIIIIKKIVKSFQVSRLNKIKIINLLIKYINNLNKNIKEME